MSESAESISVRNVTYPEILDVVGRYFDVPEETARNLLNRIRAQNRKNANSPSNQTGFWDNMEGTFLFSAESRDDHDDKTLSLAIKFPQSTGRGHDWFYSVTHGGTATIAGEQRPVLNFVKSQTKMRLTAPEPTVESTPGNNATRKKLPTMGPQQGYDKKRS